MKLINRFTSCLILLVLASAAALGSSLVHLTPRQLVDASDVVLRGTITGLSCFRGVDGLIYTRAVVQVQEPLKGVLPSSLLVFHRGGQVGGEHEFFGLSPNLNVGEEYLLLLRRGANGRLECTQGTASAFRLYAPGQDEANAEILDEVRRLTKNKRSEGVDVTDQAAGPITAEAATGMLNGIASRFLQPDRGEPIPYLIDATSLPPGISFSQATNAVQQALNAWVAVTTLRLKLEAIQNFGQGADTITASDGKLRIQLHDNFNRINTTGTLGIGGRNALSSPVGAAGWDLGGNVAGNEFRRTSRGYVVLEATHPSMQNLSTFTEVLCHEIGHALSLAHSSESASEPNTTLKQAIMYFTAHADGRGATLGTYDVPVIRQAYPQFNTAPFTYNRVLNVVTLPFSAPNIPGINEVEMRGYDLQTPNPVISTDASSGVGTGSFSRVGNLLKFTPNDYYGTNPLDPASNSFYEIIYARFSDGTNASPYAMLRVMSHSGDSEPYPSGDGLPDNWMITYFGNEDPSAGPNRGPDDDYDGDGLSNMNEFRTGMDPTSAASVQRMTITPTDVQWQAKPYELYELLSSTDLTNWSLFGSPVVPLISTASISISTSNTPGRFFRVLKVP